MHLMLCTGREHLELRCTVSTCLTIPYHPHHLNHRYVDAQDHSGFTALHMAVLKVGRRVCRRSERCVWGMHVHNLAATPGWANSMDIMKMVEWLQGSKQPARTPSAATCMHS